MAAPNLANAVVTAKVVRGALTTSAAAIVSNASGSSTAIKVSSLIVANIDGAAPQDVTINHYTAAAIGGTATAIASTIAVPNDASLVVISKNNPVYLEEDMSLGGLAGADGDLVYVCSYEIYS